MEIVEIDGSGRVYIPAHVRKKFRSRKFRLLVVEGGILLQPLEEVEELYGAFKPARYKTLEEIEEALRDAAQVDIR